MSLWKWEESAMNYMPKMHETKQSLTHTPFNVV